ncbi:MAG: hypothetical protein A2085_04160 [Gemmatimonadetes bacterium GWC2_71_10]|nr:MAG: hypothetical protein A2085_04160 [Gemmatimonadetes bacterium GWC2_71_10]
MKPRNRSAAATPGSAWSARTTAESIVPSAPVPRQLGVLTYTSARSDASSHNATVWRKLPIITVTPTIMATAMASEVTANEVVRSRTARLLMANAKPKLRTSRRCARRCTSHGTASGTAPSRATPSTNPAGRTARPSVRYHVSAAASSAPAPSSMGSARAPARSCSVMVASRVRTSRRLVSSAGPSAPAAAASSPSVAAPATSAGGTSSRSISLSRYRFEMVALTRSTLARATHRPSGTPIATPASPSSSTSAKISASSWPRVAPQERSTPNSTRRRTSAAWVLVCTRKKPTTRLMRLRAVRLSRNAASSPAARAWRCSGARTSAAAPTRAARRGRTSAACAPSSSTTSIWVSAPRAPSWCCAWAMSMTTSLRLASGL